MAPITLYYTPGACSLSPHIALRESGLPFELAKVDLRNKKLFDGGDWLAINPKGYVPAVKLADGHVLTEGAIIIQYIADHAPDAHLAPAYGTFERYRLNETLHFIATELHKGTSPLYNTLASDDLKTSIKERVGQRWSAFAKQLAGHQFIAGDHFTIADCYAFYVMRAWQHTLKQDLARWPELAEYYHRLAQRPSIAAALAAEGIQA